MGAIRCPQCGAEAEGSATQDGLCLGCLLQLAIDTDQDDPDARSSMELPNIPGYRLQRLLGAGGMGEVYLAEEDELDRQVAIKVISARLPEGRREEARRRFRREARAMAAVEHPHIVRVYRIGTAEDGRDFMAMEYVRGGTLAEMIRRKGRLSPFDALGLFRQAVEALAAALDRELIHRDIKPANLFVDGDGRLRVGDFGLARPMELPRDDALTGLGGLMGTPAYVSPEQARGESVDHRSDIYSLGIVLFEMLEGSPPFAADNAFDLIYRHLHEALPDLGQPVPVGLRALLDHMSAKSRDLRPSTYEELLDAIDALLETFESPTAPTEALPSRLFESILSSARRDEIPLGPLVAKRCNRLRQMMAFAHHFRSSRLRHPGLPLVYLVPGLEGQSHESLIERFVEEHVTRALEESRGPAGGVLRRRIAWPEGGTLTEMRAYLETDLFTALDAGYAGLDLSAPTLARLPALAPYRAIVVQHEIRSRLLDRSGLDLIDWYLNHYWCPLDAQAPLFVVFLSLVHPIPGFAEGWAQRLSFGLDRKRRIEKRLSTIFASRDRGAGRLMLDELTSVHVDHVKDWFKLHHIYETEKERREQAEGLFRTAKGLLRASLPMDEVEFALARVHGDFLKRKGLYR